MKHFDLFWIEHATRWYSVAAVGSTQYELHRHSGDDKRNHDKLFESLAVLDHTLLDAQPLTLEGPEQLLDVPAQAIPANHGECLLNALDRMCREQAPADSIARRRIEFANFDGE